MKESQKVKFVTDYTYEDEVKRFYITLCEIIEKPPDDFCAMMGLVVPITVKTGDKEKLKDGGLTRIIMEKVNAPPASNDHENESCCCCFCCCCKNRDAEWRLIPGDDSSKQTTPGAIVHDETGTSTSGYVASSFDERNPDL